MASSNRNIIVFDWDAQSDDPFTKQVCMSSGELYTPLGLKVGKFFKIRNLFLVLKIVINRKKYDKIIFWQQLHGILFAFICAVLKLKKYNRTLLLTLIYKEESGIKGRLKKLVFDVALKSEYIDRVVCYSQNECELYSRLFNFPIDKFDSTRFGIADEGKKYDTSVGEERIIVAAGKSNRDYNFLVEALNNTAYKVIIIDSTCKITETNNISVLRNVSYGDELYSIMSKAAVVFIPLKNKKISSGQTVIEQAMMFGKPVIVTESEAVLEYVVDGVNGFIIDKNKSDLLEKLNCLYSDSELYNKMSNAARDYFENNFSVNALGRNIGEIAKMI